MIVSLRKSRLPRLITAGSFLMSWCVMSSQLSSAQAAWLHGRLVDMRDALILQARVAVVLSSASGRYETDAGNKGTFSFEVPPGEYQLSVESANFIPYRRAPLVLAAGKHVYINVRPAWRAPVDPDIKHRRVAIAATPAINAWIRYVSERRLGEEAVFGGEYLMLSHDTMSVYGDRITCNLRTARCVATGESVLVEHGRDQYRVVKADIDFQRRHVTMTQEPVIVRSY